MFDLVIQVRNIYKIREDGIFTLQPCSGSGRPQNLEGLYCICRPYFYNPTSWEKDVWRENTARENFLRVALNYFFS